MTVRDAGAAVDDAPSAAESAHASLDAQPTVGEVLRRARAHSGLSLRQVEQRSGIANAHLSQIERGRIKHPDIGLLLELAHLYRLDPRLITEWAGYVPAGEPSPALKDLTESALQAFMRLDLTRQYEALEYLKKLAEVGQPRT